jgi:cell shape-determining protein MreC
VRYVSHLESVSVGDDVFSSGEGMVFPKGFALGKVISADKGDLFYTITVQPALDFQSLRYCTLIAKENI